MPQRTPASGATFDRPTADGGMQESLLQMGQDRSGRPRLEARSGLT